MRKITNTKTTLREYKKLLKRYKLGDVSCSFEIASYLASGWKWDQHEIILRYFKESFELGNIESAYELGLYFDADNNPHKSRNKSLGWLKKAAKAGHVEACNNIAFVLEHDLKRPIEANKWYELGARRGDAIAQFNLGISYEKGFGTKKNKKLAIKYFQMAKEQNFSEASYKLRKLKA